LAARELIAESVDNAGQQPYLAIVDTDRSGENDEPSTILESGTPEQRIDLLLFDCATAAATAMFSAGAAVASSGVAPTGLGVLGVISATGLMITSSATAAVLCSEAAVAYKKRQKELQREPVLPRDHPIRIMDLNPMPWDKQIATA
jgi:hypothetical protein